MATLSYYAIFEEANGAQYAVEASGAVTTAKTLIQIKPGAAMPLELVEVGVDGQSDTADAMEILILRLSAAATVTSYTPKELMEDGPAAAAVGGTAATGVDASANGTASDILVRRNASVQAGGGFFWSRNMGGSKIFVPAAGLIAVKSNITIT